MICQCPSVLDNVCHEPEVRICGNVFANVLVCLDNVVRPSLFVTSPVLSSPSLSTSVCLPRFVYLSLARSLSVCVCVRLYHLLAQSGFVPRDYHCYNASILGRKHGILLARIIRGIELGPCRADEKTVILTMDKDERHFLVSRRSLRSRQQNKHPGSSSATLRVRPTTVFNKSWSDTARGGMNKNESGNRSVWCCAIT